MYSAGVGRFLATDQDTPSIQPGKPQSWNRYSYAAGDFVDGMNPAGLDALFGGNGTGGDISWYDAIYWLLLEQRYDFRRGL
jgi:hypothetical protein